MDRIVYFIGAGLTKSLENGNRPVPMMWDFVSTMAHYLDDDVICTTMVDLERADLTNRGEAAPYFHRVAELFGVDAQSMRIHNSSFVDYSTAL